MPTRYERITIAPTEAMEEAINELINEGLRMLSFRMSRAQALNFFTHRGIADWNRAKSEGEKVSGIPYLSKAEADE